MEYQTLTQQQKQVTQTPQVTQQQQQTAQQQQLHLVQQQIHQLQQQNQTQSQQIMHLQLPYLDCYYPRYGCGGNHHDATVLNLPTSLANFVQLSQAQFVNATTGQIMGLKIEK
ncbi:hypothetical protein EVAR_73249_1 [Eumeta japonica]|uniref:Uncharacterized protein n=1 Tax=Eumeta variegata TaxID=151549 RepID=A0A4C1TSC8_EUMVA|nr:hypothetical protein EVAR_73249_1 [Eumeta japonica]